MSERLWKVWEHLFLYCFDITTRNAVHHLDCSVGMATLFRLYHRSACLYYLDSFVINILIFLHQAMMQQSPTNLCLLWYVFKILLPGMFRRCQMLLHAWKCLFFFLWRFPFSLQTRLFQRTRQLITLCFHLTILLNCIFNK